MWHDLARQGDRVLEYADWQTVWMHHWIGLAFARAGDGYGPTATRPAAALPDGRASGHWSTLGASILEGEFAIVRGDLATAARLMAPAVEQIHTMGGGSREQKDIFRDVLLEVHRRLGHVEDVIALAQQRLLANPHHAQSLAALAWAYERRATPPSTARPAGNWCFGPTRSPGPGLARAAGRPSGAPDDRLIDICRDCAED